MKRIRDDERGIASILISITIVTVVSLIVLGFAAQMRRLRQQALDQQLSSQAYYAAEAKLNETVAAIRANPSAVTEDGSCTSDDSPSFSTNDEIRSTCVLVNPAPSSLEYDEVRTDGSTLSWLKPEAGKSFRRFVISWDSKSNPNGNCASSYALPTSRGTNDIGFLKIDMTRANNVTRPSLITNTFSSALVPNSSGTFSNAFSGDVANNTTPTIFGMCYGSADPSHLKSRAEIVLPAAETGPFILRLRAIYQPSKVRIIAYDDSGAEVKFLEGQVIVDVTAKVSSVVRRLQARIPLTVAPGDYADFATRSTDSLCKLLQTEPYQATTIGSCP